MRYIVNRVTVKVASSSNRPQGYGGYHFYFGLIHSHSALSDGAGTASQAYTYARNIGKLDFFSLTEHNNVVNGEWNAGSTEGLFRDKVIKAANDANEDGEFVAFAGWEWTSGPKGHIAMIHKPGYEAYLHEDEQIKTMANIYGWLKTAGDKVVAFFNHPGDYDSGKEFDHFETEDKPQNIVGMELFNKGYIEKGAYRNGPFTKYYYNTGYSKVSAGNPGKGKNYYDMALLNGWRIGASGSDDNHVSTWGTANDWRLVILSKELTRAALFEAMQERRFYSTLDKNLGLSFCIGGNEMGSVIAPGAYTPLIRANSGAGKTFNKVQLYKNGGMAKEWTLADVSAVNLADFAIRAAAGDYYYVKISQTDNAEAISSPIWIK
jgi:hypothetical protein